MCGDYTQEKSVNEMKKFTEKASITRIVENLSLKNLRTFKLAVFRHKTFCRFSDLQQITLGDVFHEVDYFKIHIGFTKTDQQDEGQWLFCQSLPFRHSHMLMCLLCTPSRIVHYSAFSQCIFVSAATLRHLKIGVYCCK